MNQSQALLLNPSNPRSLLLSLVGWKDSIMTSGFGSYYLDLVSITFYTTPTSIPFSENFLNSSNIRKRD